MGKATKRKRSQHELRPVKRQHTRTSKTPAKQQQNAKSQHQHRQQQQPTIPFAPEERILLVGEGDFSYARSIVQHHGCADVIATCLDTQEGLFAKYSPQGSENVSYLEDEGQTVLYAVDATALSNTKALKKSGLFDRIIFNFPHVGGKSKDVNRQVRFNQELLVQFFKSAVDLLLSEGTIVVTLFEGEPYTLWNVRDLARHSGLHVIRSFKFISEAYPGYSHARTLGNIEGGGGWKGEDRESRSYVFGKQAGGKTDGSSPRVEVGGQSKKRSRKESSDEDD